MFEQNATFLNRYSINYLSVNYRLIAMNSNDHRRMLKLKQLRIPVITLNVS